jgi:hypothetical protein
VKISIFFQIIKITKLFLEAWNNKRIFADENKINDDKQPPSKRLRFEPSSSEVKGRYVSKKERKQLEQQNLEYQTSQCTITWTSPEKYTSIPLQLQEFIENNDISKVIVVNFHYH